MLPGMSSAPARTGSASGVFRQFWCCGCSDTPASNSRRLVMGAVHVPWYTCTLMVESTAASGITLSAVEMVLPIRNRFRLL